MTPKKSGEPEEEDSLGVLDDTPSSDTAGIGILGTTAHVSVVLPSGDGDDLVDDEVVDGEVASDLIIDTSAVVDAEVLARYQQDAPDIVIELPAEDLPAAHDDDAEPELLDDETPDAVQDDAPEVVAEIVDESEPVEPGSEAAEPGASESDAEDSAAAPDPDADVAAETDAEPESAVEAESPEPEPDPEPEPEPAPDAVTEAKPEPKEPVFDTSGLAHLETVVAAAKAELRQAMSPSARSDSGAGHRSAEPAEEHPVADEQQPAPRSSEAVRPASDVELSSRRLGELGGAASRESADLLTADRLLDPSRVTRPEPEGTWSHLLYTVSGGRINVGDSRRARERKQLTARIAAPMAGTARFIPVLSRKGGVGKTTVTALLGMALADARDDRVIAVDANPDRGTLVERVVGSHSKSVRDLVRAQHDIRGFHDISALVARDETRLDVLASDSDPRISEAFGDADYRDVATVAAQYYSLVLTDSGTGIVHSVMGATLGLADQLVIVSGLSVDEARLASETLTWLETNGHAELARGAVVVLNQSTPGAPLVRLGELEAHFATRVKHVQRVPYDPQIAGGGPIDFARLQPETRRAAREIAATLVESLRTKAA